MIKVSVIIPVYNSEDYLPMAMESLLKQTLKEIEIICVDDGSTDSSLQILEAYQKLDDRIVVLRQKNSYAGVARNYGMSIARGKYLSFLDADDYFVPEMLEKAYNNAEEQKADVVVFGGNRFEQNLKCAISYPTLLNEKLIPAGNGFNNLRKLEDLMLITNPAAWNKLFLHEFIKKNQLQFQICKRGNDAYFVIVALALANKIGIVRERLIYYRTGNSKSLQGTNNETPEYFAEVFLDIQKRLKREGIFEEIKRSFRELCLSTCIYNLESLTDENAFERLYYALKNGIFEQFGIESTSEEDFYNKNAYEKYLYILSHTSTEYWLGRYLFPYLRIPKGSHIVLYGGGQVGRTFYRQIKKNEYCVIDEWVDQRVRKYDAYFLKQPEQIRWDVCNYVVIAIENEKTAEDIRNQLIREFGVFHQKIIWEKPS